VALKPERGAQLGEHVWLNNRDERFTTGLDTLIGGLTTAQRPRRRRSQ
jgi:hypothetical protein